MILSDLHLELIYFTTSCSIGVCVCAHAHVYVNINEPINNTYPTTHCATPTMRLQSLTS